MTQLQKMLADQMSAANIQAENAAKAKAEATITQASKWAGEQIRTAATEAAKTVVETITGAGEVAHRDARTSTVAAWVSCGAAIVACVVAATIWLH